MIKMNINTFFNGSMWEEIQSSQGALGPMQRWAGLFMNPSWPAAAAEYWVDAFQRSVLFTDILRKRGNNYIRHAKEGMPPVLVFKYEMVMDGRELKRPVNYALVRIINRRSGKSSLPEKGNDRRKWNVSRHRSARKRPIVIIDPRAGHGPGIGGSKQDSEIGMALDAGHPVYFVIFFPTPEKGQTLTAVLDAKTLFLKTVAGLHPKLEKPVVIGNCQAGWAAALVGASRPDVAGPMVFNGSPLSYWGGVDGTNPLRYRGGLLGGAWLTSFASDLGNGQFDGAHIVAAFEDLNPANTCWTKQYNVYSQVDSEEKRYLDFEKWWNGFYMMNGEEMHFIVDRLFIGNKLEQGELALEDGKTVNLKNIREPIVVFASKGDNITPPQQALNWIVKVWGSVEALKQSGQVIVYILHEKVGHLGIFVSSGVARKEHREIIGSFEMLDYLAPGLYEMVIDEAADKKEGHAGKVRFEEREMSHILELGDGRQDEAEFQRVDYFSKMNDRFYQSFISPWVRMATTEASAEWLRQMHPLRISNYLFSDMNPFLLPVKAMAESVKASRQPVSQDNPFLSLEREFSKGVVDALNFFRDVRDTFQEVMFKSIYSNPWMQCLFPSPETADEPERETAKTTGIDDRIRKEAESGGFVEAALRVIIALIYADGMLDRGKYDAAETVVLDHPELRNIDPFDLKRVVKQQAMLLQANQEVALGALPELLEGPSRRREVLRIAHQVVSLCGDSPEGEKVEMVQKIKGLLS
jgi:hypothetical protein